MQVHLLSAECSELIGCYKILLIRKCFSENWAQIKKTNMTIQKRKLIFYHKSDISSKHVIMRTYWFRNIA